MPEENSSGCWRAYSTARAPHHLGPEGAGHHGPGGLGLPVVGLGIGAYVRVQEPLRIEVGRLFGL